MQKFLLIALLVWPMVHVGQTVDSIAWRQVDSLIKVSNNCISKREYSEALVVLETARKTATLLNESDSASSARVYTNFARVYSAQGDYPQSEVWYLKVIDIRRVYLGVENLLYANSINNMGIMYWRWGKYSQSETLLLEAKLIREKLLGKDHLLYGETLNALANLYSDLEEYDKTEQLNLENLKIQENRLGKEHPEYAGTLTNLGNVYQNMNYFEQAEPYQLEALEIRGKVLGKRSLEYAQSLNNLGVLYRYMGNYERAEALFLEAQSIRGEVLGKDHPAYAQVLSNLGWFYAATGDVELAEELFLEALKIRAASPGKAHPIYAYSLMNLGSVYLQMEKYDTAALYLLEAKDLQKKIDLNDDAQYLSILFLLADTYRKQGSSEKAKELYDEANSLLSTLKHMDNSIISLGFISQAEFYRTYNDFSKAEEFYLKAYKIRSEVLTDIHPNYADIVQKLAYFYWFKGDNQASKYFFIESDTLQKNIIKKASFHLNEYELSGYIKLFQSNLDQNFSFFSEQPELFTLAYDNALFYKGFLLNAVTQVNNLALKDSLTTEKYLQLKSYRRRLSAEYAKPIADQKNVAELEEKANDIEKDLTRSVAGYGNANRQVTWQEVQQQLKPGEAAIEFIHYRFVDPHPTDSIQYAALVLTAGASSPAFVPLFEEKQLDALLQSQGKLKDEFVNGLYTHPRLYELLWQPLELALAGIDQVYFSMTGLLHRIHLGAVATLSLGIGDPTAATLSDQYHFSQLGSTRQLVISSEGENRDQGALLYGGIQYELDSTAITVANAGLKSQLAANGRGVNFVYSDSTARGDAWNYLKWTEVEISATESILSDQGQYPVARLGYAATEESFKQLSATEPRIIHLATHGYFFPDPLSTSTGSTEPVFKLSEHPMIRSGLVLAGGNYAWQTGKPFRPDVEDGILTAYEISQMDLRSTELVVLSACETGLGDIQGNEGVYGLQRAFKIAGAKYLIMSLWQVPDFHTQELMTTFYSYWLEDNMPIPEAFRSAQEAMRVRYGSPYLWAGFVLVE